MFRSDKQTYLVNGWMWTKVQLLKTLTCSSGTELKHILVSTYVSTCKCYSTVSMAPSLRVCMKLQDKKMSILW